MRAPWLDRMSGGEVHRLRRRDIAVHPFTGHEVPAAHVERQLKHPREFGAELSRR